MSLYRKVELQEESENVINDKEPIVADTELKSFSNINDNLIKIIEDIVEKYLNKKKSVKSKIKIANKKTIEEIPVKAPVWYI